MDEQNKGVNHNPCLACGRLIKRMRGTVIVLELLYLRGRTAFLRGSCSNYRFNNVNLMSSLGILCVCVFNALAVLIYKNQRLEYKSVSHLSKLNTSTRWCLQQWRTLYYFFVFLQCVHCPEVYDDVDAGAAGRFHPRIQTRVPVAMLALLWECLHHLPLPWAGENPYCGFILCAYGPVDDNHWNFIYWN